MLNFKQNSFIIWQTSLEYLLPISISLLSIVTNGIWSLALESAFIHADTVARLKLRNYLFSSFGTKFAKSAWYFYKRNLITKYLLCRCWEMKTDKYIHMLKLLFPNPLRLIISKSEENTNVIKGIGFYLTKWIWR